MKGRAQCHFRAMAKHVGLERGFNPKTKIRLCFQFLSAEVLNAAPVRARKNLHILHASNRNFFKQALGVSILSCNCAAEVLVGPLDLHCGTLTSRFLKKVMRSNDILKSCVVRSRDKNVEQDITVLKVLENHFAVDENTTV